MASNMKALVPANLVENIMHAIQATNLDKVKELLSKGGKGASDLTINNLCLPKSGDSLLHIAARMRNCCEILRYLIEEQNGNLELANTDGKTPLHEAAQFNHLDSVQLLLEHGANVNALKRADWTPLMLACTKTDSLDVITLLLAHKSDIFFANKDGWNCFHVACREGNVDIVQKLISHVRENCNEECKAKLLFAKSKNGRNALHTAVMHGHHEVCKILLEQAKSMGQVGFVNESDKCGSTPVMEACRFGQSEILRLLHERGGIVTPEITNLNGMNCVHIAAEAGQTEIMLLLKTVCDFDVDFPNQVNGLTALHYAAREDQIEAIQLLLLLGADPNQTDHKGWTCLDLSKRLKKIQAHEILLNFQESQTAANISI